MRMLLTCFYCSASTGEEEEEGSKEVQLCQHCQKVAVCSSEDHAGIHRPQGLGQCLPIRVEQSPEVGRFLVAARDIDPGEIVILDKSILVAPDAPVCLGCLKSVRIQETAFCSTCRFPVCDAECEKRPFHAENECRVFSEAGLTILNIPTAPQFIYHCIGILRTLLAQRRSEKVRKSIQALMSHTEER